MKQLIITAVIMCIGLVSFPQTDTVPSITPFEDASIGLFKSKVIEVPNKSQKDLIVSFKNWASMAFVNLKEVLVSETENQLVLVYIVKTTTTVYIGKPKKNNLYTFDNSWYVRMITQFKDNKLKVSLYDDGSTPNHELGLGARAAYVRDYDKYLTGPKPKTFDELRQAEIGGTYQIRLFWENKVIGMIQQIETHFKTPETKLPDF